METDRQGQAGYLEKVEPRVSTRTAKPIKMDKETEDSCRRRHCGNEKDNMPPL